MKPKRGETVHDMIVRVADQLVIDQQGVDRALEIAQWLVQRLEKMKAGRDEERAARY